MKTREEILEFVKKVDFAYVYGSGKMYATDGEQREELASLIENVNYIVPVVDMDEEGCGASELKDEEGNVYKCYNHNEEPLYIVVYPEYRVEDTEAGNYVFYKSYNKAEAITEVLELTEDGLEVDLYEDDERIWCSAINTINELKNV